MADYNFTVRNHYQPFSMQEMLTPFLMYNEAYEKVDEAYTELQKKADVFSNLADSLPGQSKAAEIYNGYANDLRAQAEDLAKNGLSMNNRRALSSLKRRYEGEIGRLDRANTTFQEVLKARRAAQEQGLPMLYATNNLTIDSFLDDKSPNMFGINSNELYTRGAAIGKSLSSREFGFKEGETVLGGLYKDIIQTNGIKDVGKFMSSPELQAYIDKVLQARGVTGNLSEEDYMRARQSLENGIYEGIVYAETHNPQRDYSVPTWEERERNARSIEANALARDRFNEEKAAAQEARDRQDQLDHLIYEFDEDGKITGFRKDMQLPPGTKYNPFTQKTEKMTEKEKAEAGGEDTSTSKNAAKALSNLKGSELASNKGFDVKVETKTGVENRHYDYAGIVSMHRGKGFRHGLIGSDIEGRGWGFTSDSNTMNWWGKYSMGSIDNDEKSKVRVLGENEFNSLLFTGELDEEGNPIPNELGREIREVVKEWNKANGKPEDYWPDFEVVEVPNEGGGNRKSYSIAVRTK